ncbi:hypothetical protein PPERSA_05647 [Pseudocohnilembus persalinus]|uniref:Proteasome subunit beta n=1 Tax=Pseudocohnilembus persalinus TaxID=266149 RepID=A0A0V0QQ32_PSEPJ|nr:hypothetical protein PPERSA_05647 [Pseudocohnilembus persalinus]|eukprot:KRX04386.1 hypothetical protein PPERSA_05647 [Pseudocohnilembus persalinus]
MDYLNAIKENQGGFDFDNTIRNKHILQKTNAKLSFTKTGTTIVGMCFKDGVILGADTRATAGPTVADKNCEKLHYLAPNMRCAGAGTAADNQWVTLKLASQLELQRLNSGRESRVMQAATTVANDLYRYQGHIGAYLIIGGVDVRGPQLCEVMANGCVFYKPYATLGSGSVHAMSIMESGYKDDLTEEEAKELVCRCVEAGIVHDLGSGSNVDLCVIRKGKTEYLRNYKQVHSQKQSEPFDYKFPKGNTPFVKQFDIKFEKTDVTDKMELE